MDKRQEASHELELIAMQTKEVVGLLREDPVSPEMAYALTYELRTRLGRVVASLGAGLPPRGYRNGAADILDRAVQ